MYEILSGDDFRKNYGGVYRSIFSDRVVRRASFNKPDWKYAITTAGFLKVEGNFEALSHAAAFAGDERIVCTEIESANNGLTAVFRRDYSSFLEVLADERGGLFAGFDAAIFAQSGRWGAMESKSFIRACGCTIFGAEETIIDAWAAKLGGVQHIQEEFLAYLDVSSQPPLSRAEKISLVSQLLSPKSDVS